MAGHIEFLKRFVIDAETFNNRVSAKLERCGKSSFENAGSTGRDA
ncbi:MAG: hypothetical protein AB1733_23900 [Thermodesulfobacteriota bacterium]